MVWNRFEKSFVYQQLVLLGNNCENSHIFIQMKSVIIPVVLKSNCCIIEQESSFNHYYKL